MRRARAFVGASLLGCVLAFQEPAIAIDLAPLWDFKDPAASEQRFRAALASATGDDALVLRTQIARTHGLRKDFDGARRVLAEVAPHLASAGAEVKVRYWLELGRTYASATHAPAQLDERARGRAREAYQAALDAARAAQLDALAVDAIHMFAFLDTAPADQLKWGQAALAVVEASRQPDARRWEASVRNNIGYALHQLGRFDEALAQFQAALAIRERGTNDSATRVARWMVAWTLRSLNRQDEAFAIQLRLAQENDAAGQPDAYVFEELETLYRAQGDGARAAHYAARKQALAGRGQAAP